MRKSLQSAQQALKPSKSAIIGGVPKVNQTLAHPKLAKMLLHLLDMRSFQLRSKTGWTTHFLEYLKRTHLSTYYQTYPKVGACFWHRFLCLMETKNGNLKSGLKILIRDNGSVKRRLCNIFLLQGPLMTRHYIFTLFPYKIHLLVSIWLCAVFKLSQLCHFDSLINFAFKKTKKNKFWGFFFSFSPEDDQNLVPDGCH